MRLPDPAGSRAFLFGASHVTDPAMPDLPAVANNLTRLSQILTSSEGTGLPTHHCVTLPQDETTYPAILSALTSLKSQAQDLLLVYYAGHGVIGPDHELYLSLPSTNSEGEMIYATALPFAHLRKVLVNTAAENRVLIMDCCFSGMAIDAMGSSIVSGQLRIDGTCILTSSPANMPAKAPIGATYTSYSGELIRVLEEGIPGRDTFLSLQLIHEQIDRSMMQRGLPRPEIRTTRTAGNLALVRNRLVSPIHAKPPVRRSRPVKRPARTLDLAAARRQRAKLLKDAKAGNNTAAILRLIELLEHQEDYQEAAKWYRTLAESGNTTAMRDLVELLDMQGDDEGASHWYRALIDVAETGDLWAMWRLVELLETLGNEEGAVHWYRRLADTGNSLAKEKLLNLTDRHHAATVTDPFPVSLRPYSRVVEGRFVTTTEQMNAGKQRSVG